MRDRATAEKFPSQRPGRGIGLPRPQPQAQLRIVRVVLGRGRVRASAGPRFGTPAVPKLLSSASIPRPWCLEPNHLRRRASLGVRHADKADSSHFLVLPRPWPLNKHRDSVHPEKVPHGLWGGWSCLYLLRNGSSLACGAGRPIDRIPREKV
ncbi:hypothetical protein GQ53DRAFT_351057 [Thozetella sp. PMI_491]|nr:hypothetical protein GQ53DRAFT_351057 [Thozetella sp. PMI_491]